MTGCECLPTCDQAGNLIKTSFRTKLSFRIPPNYNDEKAKKELGEILCKDHQHFEVKYYPELSCPGWISGDVGEEFNSSLEKASEEVYNAKPIFLPIGASIPVMGLLQKSLKKCKILATGVNGNDSNSHSFDENLDVEKMHKFTKCMYKLLKSI